MRSVKQVSGSREAGDGRRHHADAPVASAGGPPAEGRIGLEPSQRRAGQARWTARRIPIVNVARILQVGLLGLAVLAGSVSLLEVRVRTGGRA
jgi:hypothetical protein